MNYYAVLSVSRNASTKEIKEAYRKLARKLHPDVTGNDQSKAEAFKRVNEAYHILTDPQERRQYDATFRTSYNPTAGDDRFGKQTYGPRSRRGSSNFTMYTGPAYGINEEEWLYHHYGVEPKKRAQMHSSSSRDNTPTARSPGSARVTAHMQHYKLDEKAGYFVRREERMRREAKEREMERRREGKHKDDDECVIQ